MSVSSCKPLLSLVAAVATTSCTASLDLGRFKKQEAQVVDTTNVTYFDLVFSAKNMQSHIGEYMEWRLVDKANAVQGKAVYVDVLRPDFVIQFPHFIPKSNGPYRIDWWADHNFSGKYDGIEGGINDKDHSWRRVLSDPLPEDVKLVGTRYEVSFLHDTAFVDIFTDLDGNKISGADTLLPLKLGIRGTGAYLGKMIEVRVADEGSGRLVAIHRIGRATDGYVATVTGVLDEETNYEVSVYVDANANDVYDGGDPSWKTEVVSTSAGVEKDLDLSTLQQAPIEVFQ